MGYGTTELKVSADRVNDVINAAIAAGLQVSTTVNARLPCRNETAEEAMYRFRNRINTRIQQLRERPASAHFRDVIAALIIYRDGDSNDIELIDDEVEDSPLDRAFHYADPHSSSSMDEDF